MVAERSRDLTVVLLAGAAVVALAVVGAVTVPPPMVVAGPSSFSPAPGGTKAALLVMQQLGYQVDRSFEPVTVVATDPRHTLLFLVGPEERASDQDRRAIRQFAEAGGIVLATGCAGASFLTVDTPRDAPRASKSLARARESSEWTAGASEIALAAECVNVQLGTEYRAVYGDKGGVVRIARVGEGTIQWWAGSTPLTNEAIGDAQNLALVLNAAGRGARRVLWDEYYHGQRRSLLSYAASTVLPWIAAQCLVVGLAAAMTFTRRRAPIRPRWTSGRNAPMEFVETIATLYAEAGAARAAVATSAARTRRLISEITGLPASASDDRLGAAVASRLSQDAGEIGSLLRASARVAAGPDPSVASALTIVRRLQEMSLALSGEGGRVGHRTNRLGHIA